MLSSVIITIMLITGTLLYRAYKNTVKCGMEEVIGNITSAVSQEKGN